MSNPEVGGLVLTHGQRDIRYLVGQMATVCEQLVIINDPRHGTVPPSLIESLDSRDREHVEVIDRPFDSFPQQRNAGLDQLDSNWVLSIDSDEHLSPGLMEEITAFTSGDTSSDAYKIPRREWLGSRPLRVSHPYGTTHLRLFRSDLRYAKIPTIHEELAGVNPSECASLTNAIEHRSTESLIDRYRKAYAYGSHQQQVESVNPPSWPRIAATIPGLVAKGFWRDGLRGVAVAGVHASYRLGLKLNQQKPQDIS